MATFKIWEVKNGYLLNPTAPRSINREEVIVKAKSRYDALVSYAGATGNIYFKGNQPYYRPYDNVKYVAFLHKP